MNRCALCGKFRAWDTLKHRLEIVTNRLPGDYDEDEWYECRKGTGCHES